MFVENERTLEYFVSTVGSDEDSVSGTIEDPWKTINYALEKITKSRPSKPTAEDSVVINVREGTYYFESTATLRPRASFLKIRNFRDEKVVFSGGFPLDIEWKRNGDRLSGTFDGQCASAYYGDTTLVKARSPNTKWGRNKNLAKGPYHHIKDLLKETETCTRYTSHFSQTCPEDDRLGFVFSDEFSEDWTDVDQMEIIIFHSWIAEYVKVANISRTIDGRNVVKFQKPLQSSAIGDWPKSSGWRYIILNNLALLDEPGEYVCLKTGDKGRSKKTNISFFFRSDFINENKTIFQKLKIRGPKQ